MLSPKILALDELIPRLGEHRARRERIVHCHGVFDLLHIGHIRYLRKARELGDLLVVTVTPDRFVNKGPHRPVFEEELRADAVASLDCVDYVAINDSPTADGLIRRLQPSVYAKGAEFRDAKTPELLKEESAAAEVGARVEFVEEVTSSSSQLINDHLSPFTEEAQHYLRELRQRTSAEELLSHLERARDLTVLVVGEAILDEYYSVTTLGRSARAPIVATQYQDHRRFAGGALAVANHVAGFCDRVRLVAMVGETDEEPAWIGEHLKENIQVTFVRKSGAPTIIKRQYRESYFGIPLFEMYSLDETPLSDQDDRALCRALGDALAGCDATFVADYGHTMLTKQAIEALCGWEGFLAVTTQTNAANVGFQTVARYGRADYLSLAEHELRLECRSRGGDLLPSLEQVAHQLRAGLVSVTVGSRGCLCYNRREDRHLGAPALATRVVDRFGVSDAFFAMTSLCAAADAPGEVTGLLGNVAAAEALSTVGYSRYLESLPFARHVQSLLK